MFGKKKKKNDDTLAPLSVNTDSTSIHTMQDDIDSISGSPSTTSNIEPSHSNNPFGDIDQQPMASAPQEPKSAEPVTTNPQSSPFGDIDESTASSPMITDAQNEMPIVDESQPTPSTETLDTSNPFIDDTSAPKEAATATANAVPEASSEQASQTAQKLTQSQSDPQMPPAPSMPSTKQNNPPSNGPFSQSPANTTGNPFPGQLPTDSSAALQNEISKIQEEYGDINNKNGGKHSKRSSFLSTFVIIILVILIAGGGYYYWSMQSPDANTSLVDIGKNTYNDIINGNSESDNTSSSNNTNDEITYSETIPEYVVIDTQSSTASEDFSAQMQIFSQNITAQQPLNAIAFNITDENGAPLAFDRFALITGITLPPEVLSQLDESFLLYGYYDTGEVRFGLSIKTISPESAFETMKAAESTLVPALTPLFAGSIPEIVNPTFKDSIYNNTPIRYANLNNNETLSVDYATYSGDLVIGTSKGTIRGIIDTL